MCPALPMSYFFKNCRVAVLFQYPYSYPLLLTVEECHNLSSAHLNGLLSVSKSDGSGRRMKEVACPICTVHLQVRILS